MVFALLAIGILTGSFLGVSTVIDGGSVLQAIFAYTLGGSLGTVAAAILNTRLGPDTPSRVSAEEKFGPFETAPDHLRGSETSRDTIAPRRIQIRDRVDRTQHRESRAIARRSRRNLLSETF
jgi:hypothetical protein